MGDAVNRDRADKFEDEFGDDFITKYRSPLLDAAFGEGVIYSLSTDDSNWETHLVAIVTTAQHSEVFILAHAPSYCVAEADDEQLVRIVTDALDLDEDEATSRLVDAGLIDVPVEDRGTPNDPAWHADDDPEQLARDKRTDLCATCKVKHHEMCGIAAEMLAAEAAKNATCSCCRQTLESEP